MLVSGSFKLLFIDKCRGDLAAQIFRQFCLENRMRKLLQKNW